MRGKHAAGGFSLVEVATSIGVIAFALVALLGVFPLGLENGRQCVADTRATQLVRTLAATLESEPFAAAPCFAETNAAGNGIDFTKLGTADALNAEPDLVLYASYDVTALPRLLRAAAAPPDAIYRIELRGRRQMFTPLGTAPPRVAGTNLNVRIAGLREKQPFAESWFFLPNVTRP